MSTIIRCQCWICGACPNGPQTHLSELCPACYHGDHYFKRSPRVTGDPTASIEPIATHCQGCGYPLSDQDIAEDDDRCGGCREELAWSTAEDSGVALARELAEEMRGDTEREAERPYGIDGSEREG